jgi:hypothetical protein
MGALLNSENFLTGLLVDEELLGGVSQDPQTPGRYIAYVLRHTTGEYLGYVPNLLQEEALALLNRVERSWVFESTSACGGCDKKGSGKCDGNQCAIKKAKRKAQTLPADECCDP